VDQTIAAEPRGPIVISRPAAIIVLLWLAMIVELGVLAVAVGWAPNAPVSRVLDALLWPGSLVALVVLGALPRRGGLLLGLLGGLLVGLTYAIVVSVLPDAQMPLDPPTAANRVYSIIEAVWMTPILGVGLAGIGLGIRRLVLRGEPSSPADFEQDDDAESDRQNANDLFGSSNQGYVPVGLAMVAGAAVSLAVSAASQDLTPSPH
jgi:hypothetical protein